MEAVQKVMDIALNMARSRNTQAKLKLSHHQYKPKAKKHEYYYQSRAESSEGEPAVKKGKNEHKKTVSNTAITGTTDRQNRVVAALLTVPNQTIKHSV